MQFGFGWSANQEREVASQTPDHVNYPESVIAKKHATKQVRIEHFAGSYIELNVMMMMMT